MKNINRIIVILALVILPRGYASAQEQPKSEIGVHGGLGLSSVRYKPELGKQRDRMGFNLGFNYAYFFNDRVGIRSGLEIATYNSTIEINSFNGTLQTNDGEEDFELRYSIDRYKEKLSTTYLNIPLMVQYQMPLCRKHQYYVAGGGKIGIPLTNSVTSKNIEVNALGFYDNYGKLIIDDAQGQGFGTFVARDVDDKLRLKASFMLSAETGVKWNISWSKTLCKLYTGAFLDYGLNNIVKSEVPESSKMFLIYNQLSPSEYIINSVFLSGDSPLNRIDHMKTFSVGVIVRLAYAL